MTNNIIDLSLKRKTFAEKLKHAFMPKPKPEPQRKPMATRIRKPDDTPPGAA
jgi:hypothetical protein